MLGGFNHSFVVHLISHRAAQWLADKKDQLRSLIALHSLTRSWTRNHARSRFLLRVINLINRLFNFNQCGQSLN